MNENEKLKVIIEYSINGNKQICGLEKDYGCCFLGDLLKQTLSAAKGIGYNYDPEIEDYINKTCYGTGAHYEELNGIVYDDPEDVSDSKDVILNEE